MSQTRTTDSPGVVPPTYLSSQTLSPPPPSSSAHDQQELERTPSQLVSLPHHHLHHHEPGIETEIEAVPGPEAIRCAERDVHKLQKLLQDTCAQAQAVARDLSYCASTSAAAQLWPAQREREEQEKKINELQVKLKAAYAEVASQGRLVANAKQKSLECERREEDTRTRLELAERDGAALRELCEKHLREKEGVLKDNADLRAKYAKLTEKYGRVKGKAIEYKRRLTLAERKEDEEGDRANTLEMQKFSAKIKEEEEEEDKTSPGSLVEDEKNGDKKQRQIPSEFASDAGGIGGTGGAGGASRVKKKTETEREREVDPLRSPFDVAFSLSDQEEEEEEEDDDCNGEAEVRSSQETPTRKRPQHCQSTFRSTAAVYNNTTPGSAAAAAAATTKDSPGWIPRKLPVKEGTPRTKMRQVRLFNEDIDEFLISAQEGQQGRKRKVLSLSTTTEPTQSTQHREQKTLRNTNTKTNANTSFAYEDEDCFIEEVVDKKPHASKQEGSRSIGRSRDTTKKKGKDDGDGKVLTPPDFWHIQVTPP